MENKKGSGVFLGVVSVATLIVAIIGATFAYFSATVTSDDRVEAEAYEFNASMTITPIYPEVSHNGLIPLDPDAKVLNADGETESDKTNLLYALTEATNKCVDDNGYQVCALYQVTINNSSTQAINLSGKLITESNVASTRSGATPFANLTYQPLDGSHSDNSLALGGTAIDLIDGNIDTTLETIQKDGSITIDGIEVPGATVNSDDTLTPGTKTAYVLIYLNENGDQSAEMGATWTGEIQYASTSGDGNTLSGSFKLTGTTS